MLFPLPLFETLSLLDYNIMASTQKAARRRRERGMTPDVLQKMFDQLSSKLAESIDTKLTTFEKKSG